MLPTSRRLLFALAALLLTLTPALASPPLPEPAATGTTVYLPVVRKPGTSTEPPPLPPTGAPTISTFAASPGRITPGEPALLSWNVSAGATVTIDPPVGPLDGGSVVISPTATTRYTLTATNGQGTTSVEVTVTVAPAPPDPAPGTPPSAKLIADALAKGEIDGETALIYRTYAAFGDERLPERFRGGSDLHGDETILIEVASTLATLSPAAQETLQPFLIPPYHEGSWHALRDEQAASGISLQQESERRCGKLGDNVPRLQTWSYVVTKNDKVKIWWQRRFPNDQALAESLAKEMDDAIWPKLTSYMGREPLPDGGGDLLTYCRGGDDRLDISLTDTKHRGVAPPYEPYCEQVPAAILLDRTNAQIRGTLAHEFMHVIQWTYNVAEGCMYPGEYAWLSEATAVWAVDYVYPNDNYEHDFAFVMLDEPHRSLEEEKGINDIREYGAYLLPFFADRALVERDFVRVVWDNTERYANSLEAVDKALPGGFSEQWDRFTLLNWNRGPVTQYELWDKLKERAKPEGGGMELLRLNGQRSAEFPLVGEYNHLSARYFYKSFPEQDTRTVTFYNPFAGGVEPDARVWGLVKINGQWEPPEEWTDLSTKAFCRDKHSERIEEMVVIISNNQWRERITVMRPLTQPRIVLTNIGCWQWSGDVSVTSKVPGGLIVNTVASVTWTRTSPTSNVLPVTYEPRGRAMVFFTGTASGCTISSPQYFIDIGPTDGLLTVENYEVDSQRKLVYRGTGTSSALFTYTLTCPDTTFTNQWSGALWFATFNQNLRVDADGATMDTTDSDPSGNTTASWQFTAGRQQ